MSRLNQILEILIEGDFEKLNRIYGFIQEKKASTP